MAEKEQYVAIRFGEAWLFLSDDGETVDTVEKPEDMSVFPLKMAKEIIKALQEEGITDPFEIVPVTLDEEKA